MNFISKNAVEISPEVLTNSWLSVPLDIPNEREAIMNMSFVKGWRFLFTLSLCPENHKQYVFNHAHTLGLNKEIDNSEKDDMYYLCICLHCHIIAYLHSFRLVSYNHTLVYVPTRYCTFRSHTFRCS
jgi:hypothetical protein